MLLKGTQRRLVVMTMTLTALAPAAAVLADRPASAFPSGHKVSNFNYSLRTKTRVAKLKQTMAPPAGSYKGGFDTVTGQLLGAMKLPNATFANQIPGLGTATAALVPKKPITGKMNLKNYKVTDTATFVVRIVTAYAVASSARSTAATLPTLPVTLPTLPVTLPTLPGSLPTLPITLPTLPGGAPPVNLVGTTCSSAPITMTMHGIAPPGAISTMTGSFTIPKFTSCGALTGLINKLLPGPGNTFSATATPTGSSSPPTLPITLPTLPGSLPTLPITLPTLPVTLPTLPGGTLPTLPVTLPTLPVTLPTLPITLPTLPVTLPTLPGGG